MGPSAAPQYPVNIGHHQKVQLDWIPRVQPLIAPTIGSSLGCGSTDCGWGEGQSVEFLRSHGDAVIIRSDLGRRSPSRCLSSAAGGFCVSPYGHDGCPPVVFVTASGPSHNSAQPEFQHDAVADQTPDGTGTDTYRNRFGFLFEILAVRVYGADPTSGGLRGQSMHLR